MLDVAIIAYFILSVTFLIWSGSVLVRHLSRIAGYLKLTEFVVGFLVMATATSLPELLVGIQSALGGVPALGLGDVIGSNILDVTLVLGLVLVMTRSITIKSMTTRRNALPTILISFLPIILLVDGILSRFDGLLLLAVFAFYIRRLYTQRSSFTKVHNNITQKQFYVSSTVTALALLVLLISSYYTVQTAAQLATALGMPLYLVGIILLAFGTSLPELVFETKAVSKGHNDMAIGDLYGSIVFNTTGVLGTTALLSPIVTNGGFFFSAIFLVFSMLLFYAMIQHGRLTWRDGIVLVGLYMVFLIIELEMGLTGQSTTLLHI